MNKILIICGVVGVIVLSYFLTYKEGKRNGVNEEIAKQSKIDNEVTIEINKDRKEVIKRRQVNESVSDIDNLQWLFQNRCKDCKS